jgi:hypothetical protein
MMRRHMAWRLGAALSLTVSLARSEPANPETGPRPLAQATNGVQSAGAVVVLIGAAGHDSELPVLLRELLGHLGTTVAVTTAGRFDPNELLGSTATGAVQVFVVPGRMGGVRLYFRAPDGERFLVRGVPLRWELDAVGREQLGQIIETAVTSLLQSTDGLTREQARAAVENDGASATTSPPAVGSPDRATSDAPKPKAPARTDAPDARRTSAARTTLEGWFAVRYGASIDGAELGIAHGPGLELGFGFQHRGLRLRARGVGQRNFARQLTATGVAASLETLQLGLALDAGMSIGAAQWLLLSAGLGRDSTKIKPSARDGSTVAPAPAFEHTAPVAHVELRYELGASLVRAAVAAGADLTLVDTHYDIAQNGSRERVASQWPVHPTVSFSLGLAPRSQPF